VSDRQKLFLDKYYDIIKLRAAQVLGLFIAYGLALRGSVDFLDTSSVLAMAIPLCAFVLDMVARRHYGAPLAYLCLKEDVESLDLSKNNDEWDSPILTILDFKGKAYGRLRSIFTGDLSEQDRRKLFYKWYTFRRQLIPFLVFATFFFIAFISTL
jgi:hypothetical protein